MAVDVEVVLLFGVRPVMVAATVQETDARRTTADVTGYVFIGI
jgi:hypothetical protein